MAAAFRGDPSPMTVVGVTRGERGRRAVMRHARSPSYCSSCSARKCALRLNWPPTPGIWWSDTKTVTASRRVDAEQPSSAGLSHPPLPEPRMHLDDGPSDREGLARFTVIGSQPAVNGAVPRSSECP